MRGVRSCRGSRNITISAASSSLEYTLSTRTGVGERWARERASVLAVAVAGPKTIQKRRLHTMNCSTASHRPRRHGPTTMARSCNRQRTRYVRRLFSLVAPAMGRPQENKIDPSPTVPRHRSAGLPYSLSSAIHRSRKPRRVWRFTRRGYGVVDLLLVAPGSDCGVGTTH